MPHSDLSNLDSDSDVALDLFADPEGFYEPEKPPTFVTHTLSSGKELRLRLVGHNPLWGHHLWHAGRVVAEYLEENRETLVKGARVLELGAGAGLPSVVCALGGAEKVRGDDTWIWGDWGIGGDWGGLGGGWDGVIGKLGGCANAAGLGIGRRDGLSGY